MVSIAIIDTIGLTYDGTTLAKQGLGGSESAVIHISRELANIGFDVTVFNSCIDSNCSPGTYDGVKYVDIGTIQPGNCLTYDVVISSRTVAPFGVGTDWESQVRGKHDPQIFKSLKDNAKLKIVWMHDTFCGGDPYLERLVVAGHIDEIFTLSDFHTSYVSNCNHGVRRQFEALKNHIFITRNGIVKYQDADIKSKDPHLYVYNASVTKGMIPLVNDVWPEVKKQLPSAKLKVIGGYYRFRENAAPDSQERTWRELVADPKYAAMDIEFTGIITQREIASILSAASFTIYPGLFPETFGISSLESLAYNTPLLTTRFGALEETAIEQACYLIDYPIGPNVLFKDIDSNAQTKKFVEMVVRASKDTYRHQQKMYACNMVQDICEWSTVAIQWKQHLFRKLGLYLSRDEYVQVSGINHRVQQVFNRRFTNVEERYLPRSSEQRIVVITPMYNASQWIGKCIESVRTQDYDNYLHIIIDDDSIDDSHKVAESAASGIDQIRVYRNSSNIGAVGNQIGAIRRFCQEDDIVMLLDGDDWLVNNNQIFHYYNNLYKNGTEFSYGSCLSLVDNLELIAQPYPQSVKDARSYRSHKFNWIMPYTHLRTFRAGLILNADDANFKDDNGNWYRAGGDCSIFYTAIEAADPAGVTAVTDVFYVYNDAHPANDYKINGKEQTATAKAIISRNSMTTNTPATTNSKFSVIVPTMWRCLSVFSQSLTQMASHDLVGEIIIINNCQSATPDWEALSHPKVKHIVMPKNIYVNPSWNVGAAMSTNDLLCFANDDILFDTHAFDKVAPMLSNPDVGVIGIITGEAKFGHPQSTDYSIDITEWQPGLNIHGFGQLMFIHSSNWSTIPSGLDIYFGDDYIFRTQLLAGRTNYRMHNIRFESPMAQTTKDSSLTAGFYEREQKIFGSWVKDTLTEQVRSSKAADVPTPPAKQPEPSPVQAASRDKRILIAIPTNRYIEPETFKTIFDLKVPQGYTVEFQYFYGYCVDQIRNLIASWVVKYQYDYLFCVDSDMSFSSDTLCKLLSHDKDIVSGLYIQRKPGQHILEIYRQGRNVKYDDVKGQGLVAIDGCGFGCVLIKGEVIKKMEYPHFVYKSAIDHKNTVSEDVYFCNKARSLGFSVWADTNIKCNHHGSSTFTVD